MAKFISSQLIRVTYKDFTFNTFAKHSVFEKNISDLNAFFSNGVDTVHKRNTVLIGSIGKRLNHTLFFF